MQSICIKIIFISCAFLATICSSGAQAVQQHYALFVKGQGFKICINDQRCHLDTSGFDLRKINHFQVSGDSLAIREQLNNIKKFCSDNKNVRIRIIEYANSDDVHNLDPLIAAFDHLSILIINNCKNIRLENIINFVNQINSETESIKLKEFKRVFKKRSSIFYLNTLIFRNQELEDLGKPKTAFETYKYLEELRIENPKSATSAQKYINDLITYWIVPDTLYYMKSAFPNLRFLGFKDCQLDSIPYRMKYKYGLISLDLSGNNFSSIPEFLIDYENFETVLSLNFSNNNLQTLDQTFLDRYCKSAERGSKLSKYLFLSENELNYKELIKLANDSYKGAFNTVTFECNPIEFKNLDRVAAILKLASELDEKKVAKFMTGAQRSETDYNPYARLIGKCDE